MPRAAGFAVLLGALSLAACAAPLPAGPSVMVLPAQGKSFADFQQDDATCREFAANRINYASPGAATNQSLVNSGALGTVLGAAAGAAIGAATGGAAAGAAIGAASGLVLGTASGAGAAGYTGASLQRSYDMSYVQCMSAKGESVPSSALSAAQPYPSPYPYYGGWPYPYYAAAYPYPYPYPYRYYYPYWGYP
jgi:Glycine-zipper domain